MPLLYDARCKWVAQDRSRTSETGYQAKCIAMCRRAPDSARQNRKRAGRHAPAPRWPEMAIYRRNRVLLRKLHGGNGAAAACRLMEQTVTLLKWALIFFLVSIVAGVLGFTGISVASADVARFLFYVFVVIFLVLLILGLRVLRV